MKVLDMDAQRFDVALELLQEGKSFEFSNVSFYLDKKNQVLEVRVISPWLAENLNAEKSLAEIAKGRETYEFLSKHSEKFTKITAAFSPRFSLINDYGTGSVEICHLSNGKLVWN